MNILDLLASRGVRYKASSRDPRRGQVYHSPCPRCGGDDRFAAFPEQGEGGTWWCRGCDHGGDLLEFLRHLDGLTFAEACKKLGIEREMECRRLPSVRHSEAAAFNGSERQLPPVAWREKAAEWVARASEALLTHTDIMAWLARRGVDADCVRANKLGWLPGDGDKGCYYRPRESWGLPTQERKNKNGKTVAKKLWIPRGLLIPTVRDGQVVALRVRVPEADRRDRGLDSKYYMISGGAALPLISISGRVRMEAPRLRAWVIVESQLDALMAASVAGRPGEVLPVGAAAMLSNTGKPCPRLHSLLSAADLILVALDYDEPGATGWHWWKKTYPGQARRWPVPEGKDPGEYFSRGGNIGEWIEKALSTHIGWQRPAPPASAEPAEAPKPPPAPLAEVKQCQHDLATFQLLLGDLTPSQPFYIICGDRMATLDDCLKCNGRPHGLPGAADKAGEV